MKLLYYAQCLFLSLVVSVSFEDDEYSIVEGDIIVVCVIAEGAIDSPFTLLIETTDNTALGLSMTNIYQNCHITVI